MAIEPLAQEANTKALGLNELGHVVGVETLSDGSTRAFIWLLPSTSPHIDRYGIAPPYAGGTASNIYYLNDLTGHMDDNTATDLNDDGVVVGYVGQIGDSHATIWHLCEHASAHSCPEPDSERLVFDDDHSGQAWGVNQAPGPAVAGWHKSNLICPKSNPPTLLDRGFLAQFTLNPLHLVTFNELEVESLGDPMTTHAFAVNDSVFSVGDVASPVPCAAPPGLDCATYQYGARWAGTLGIPLADALPYREEARGIADSGIVVGLGAFQQGVSTCHTQALLWNGPAVTYLHDCLSANQSRAEAINEAWWIVGSDPDAGDALRWTPDQEQSCGFLALDLNDDPLATCGATAADLREAVAVSDRGWIVANGTASGARGFVLILENVDCVADANRDGIVDIDDLIQVFLDWTAPPLACLVTDACLGDVNYDCKVDDADLALVRSGECAGDAMSAATGWPAWVDLVLELFDANAIDPAYAAELLQAGLTADGTDDL